MLLGAHESISGSFIRAIEDALADGCECIQIFTKNQKKWREIDSMNSSGSEKRRK